MLLLLLSCQQPPEEAVQHGGITFIPMEAKHLPDLNEPRCGYALVWTGDHILVIGGRKDSYNNAPQNIVDQLKGESFEVDLLSEWHPQTPLDRNVQADAYRLAEHTFLIPALANGRPLGFNLLFGHVLDCFRHTNGLVDGR